MHRLTTRNSEFVVREPKWGNFILGLLIVAVFLISWYASDFEWGVEMNVFALLLLLAGYLFYRAARNPITILINSEGFFHKRQRITDWQHFVDIKLMEEDRRFLQVQDNFYLMIRYTKPGKNDLFGRKIKMSHTQDKADEEIVQAVKRIYNEWVDANTIITQVEQ